MLVLAGIFLATRNQPLWQKIPGFDRAAQVSQDDASVADRLVAWQIALKGAQSGPIWGAGWENFKYVFDSNYDPRLFRNGFSETYWDRPHNVFLEYLVTSGIFGLVAYLGLSVAAFYVIARKVSKDFRPYAAALLAAYLVQNFFLFDSFGTYMMLAVFLAYLASQESHSHGEPAALTGQPFGTGAGWPSARLARIGKIALIVAAAGAVGVGIATDVKIVYANHKEYWGENYIVQRLPEQGIGAFKDALKVNQPYINEIRTMYLQTLSQAAGQMTLPDAKANAQFAIDEANKVLITDDFNYFNHYILAQAKLDFGSISNKLYNGSESDIRQAMILSPKRQLNYYVYSKIKYLQGDLAGSADMMKQAVDLDPLSASPHYYYALTLLNTGKAADAAKAGDELKKAIELGFVPTDANEAKQLGDYTADANDYPDALKYYQMAIAFDNDVDANLKEGLVYMFMGDEAHAKPYLQEVLVLLPNFKSTPNFAQFKPYFDSIGL